MCFQYGPIGPGQEAAGPLGGVRSSWMAFLISLVLLSSAQQGPEIFLLQLRRQWVLRPKEAGNVSVTLWHPLSLLHFKNSSNKPGLTQSCQPHHPE